MWHSWWKRVLNSSRQASPNPTPRRPWRPVVEALESRWMPTATPLLAPDQAIALAVAAEVGTNDLRLSNMGPDGNGDFGAGAAAVAYNPTNNEYLVVWSGDDNTAPLVNDEFEVFGQRVSATTGARVGGRIRISSMGPIGITTYGGFDPAVAYNPVANEYLVVWEGDDNLGGASVDEEYEIYGQRLNAATGAEVGLNDFRISTMGAIADANYDAFNPAVAYNQTANEYLVVWEGDDNVGGLVDEEWEIFGQRLSALGEQIGADDFRISDMGPNASINFGAFSPAVAWNGVSNEYLVVWEGDDTTDQEFEIFGQRLSTAGAEVGTNDFRISDMGDNGNSAFDAGDPAVAYNPAANEYLVVWEGDDTTDEAFEIYGQRLSNTGAEVGTNDFRISDMGPEGSDDFDAFNPAVAYNPTNSEYLVVWEGDDNSSLDLGEGETEIFGQRLSAAGAELGVNDFRISDMGLNGDDDSDAFSPAVAWNSATNEYLAVWEGDDNPTGATDVDEFEIYGQRLAGATQAATVALQARVFRQKGRSLVRVTDAATGALRFQVLPFGRSYRGQVIARTADLTGDGVEDVIVLQGRGGKGLVQVYDGLTGQRRLQARVGTGAVKAALAEATGDNLIDLVVRATAGKARQRGLSKIVRGGDLAVLPGPA